MRKLHSLLALALTLTCCSLMAQKNTHLTPKQLAGPASDFQTGEMAAVDPSTTAIRSHSTMLPIQLKQGKDGSWRWRGEVAVENPSVRVMILAGGDSWQLALQAPYAKQATPASELLTEFKQADLGLAGETYPGDYYAFEEMQTGRWRLSLESVAPIQTNGFLLISSESPYQLFSYKATNQQLVGNEISFVSYGFDNRETTKIPNATHGMVHEAYLRLTSPDGEVSNLPMFDDGLHGDDLIGDGIFGGSFSAQEVGDYTAQVFVSGETPEGLPFLRSAEHLVPVIAPELDLVGDLALTRRASEGRLNIELAVDSFEGAPEKYRVFAEVWGTDEAGSLAPIAWVGGMSFVEDGKLALGLDTRWIARAGASAPFELRNLRIEDPDHFIPVSSRAAMPLLLRSLPRMSPAQGKTISEEMLMGPRPQQTRAKAGGSKLLLVHGYCSSNVWGSVSGQFSNAAVFTDLNQNRSHDAFANQIGTFGLAYDSYGIVAHSQGGAAALHLYTYYWSGLDYATGGRLIQSVGTPYQGTALAGNAAVLGQVFGVGCGTNTDLTYSGASSWLSGIPTWARNAVNYYTTSFTDKWWRYDYCHLVTDLLLNDPDDGTTEKSYGQLSSAYNRGHKTGWCHTSGMRDPAQTTDSSRNSSMNANAAR